MPTKVSTRSTGWADTASRIVAPVAVARRTARTSAVMPAESQKVVAVMSTIRAAAPWLRAESSCSRMASAFVRSISPGSRTTAVRPDQVTGKGSPGMTLAALRQKLRAGRISGPWGSGHL